MEVTYLAQAIDKQFIGNLLKSSAFSKHCSVYLWYYLDNFIFSPFGMETSIFHDNQVNTMAVDALAPSIAISPEAMKVITWDNRGPSQ